MAPKDLAKAIIKAGIEFDQLTTAALRAGVDLQNTRIVELGKEKLAAEKRGAAAQQLAAVNGRRFDGALAKLAGARDHVRRGHAGRQPAAERCQMRHQIARQIIPKIIPALVSALLAGCTTAPPPATQIVEVPIYTPCVKAMPPAPAFRFDKLSLDAPPGEKVLAQASDWLLGRKYELQLEALLAGCL